MGKNINELLFTFLKKHAASFKKYGVKIEYIPVNSFAVFSILINDKRFDISACHIYLKNITDIEKLYFMYMKNDYNQLIINLISEDILFSGLNYQSTATATYFSFMY